MPARRTLGLSPLAFLWLAATLVFSTGCGLAGLFPEGPTACVEPSNFGDVVGRAELVPKVVCRGCRVTVLDSELGASVQADGTFKLRSVPRGSQRLALVTADGRIGASHPVGVHGGKVSDAGTVYAFTELGAMSGRVVGAAGDAFASMTVSVPGLPETRPDASGHYLLPNLPPGPVHVVLTYRGLRFGADTTIRAQQVTTGVDFTGPWLPPGQVSGHVRGLGPAEMANAIVRVVGTEIAAKVGRDGAYALTGIPTGTYAVELWSAGRDTPLSRSVTVGPRPSLDVDFDVPGDGGIGAVGGRVIGLDQGAFSTAVVVVAGSALAVRLGPGGTYLLTDVPAGVRRLELRIPDPTRAQGRVKAAARVTILPDDVVLNADLRVLIAPQGPPAADPDDGG